MIIAAKLFENVGEFFETFVSRQLSYYFIPGAPGLSSAILISGFISYRLFLFLAAESGIIQT